ncbi:MAG: hypothetical protein U0414_19280 [Polyangiaceae bacterium]
MGPGTHPSTPKPAPKPTPAPAATKPAAPPPPVQPNKPVNSGANACPVHGKKRCEAAKLDLKVKYVYVNDATQSPVETHLVTKAQKRFVPIPKASADKLGRTVVSLLRRYDLVIEALAGFPNKGNEEIAEKPQHGIAQPRATAKEMKGADNIAEVEVEGEVVGDPECTLHLHPHIRMFPHTPTAQKEFEYAPEPEGHGGPHTGLRETSWKPGVKKVEVKEILAPVFKADMLGGNSAFASLFRLVMWVWHINQSLDLEFVVEACGVRSPSQAGVLNLTGLVRVYRDVNIAVGIKFPPLKKTTHAVQGKLDAEGAALLTKSEKIDWSGHKVTKNTQKTKTGFKGLMVFGEDEGECELYFKFNELEFKLKETVDKAKEQAEALAHAKENATEKYKHWKNEAARKRAIDKAMKEAFGDFLTFKDKLELFFQGLVKAVRNIVKTLTSVFDMMKKFPQLGFRLTFEVGFMSGQFFIGWAHTGVDSSQPLTTPLSDRYAPLFHKLHVEFDMMLVTIKAEASFGLFIDAGPIGSADATVAGTISLELKWATALDVILGAGWNNGAGGDVLTQGLNATATVNLRARVQVTIAWKTWKKELGIESGIVCEGRVDWKYKADEIYHFLGVRTMETGWYFYSSDFKTGEVHVSTHKIFDAKKLYFTEGTDKLS